MYRHKNNTRSKVSTEAADLQAARSWISRMTTLFLVIYVCAKIKCSNWNLWCLLWTCLCKMWRRQLTDLFLNALQNVSNTMASFDDVAWVCWWCLIFHALDARCLCMYSIIRVLSALWNVNPQFIHPNPGTLLGIQKLNSDDHNLCMLIHLNRTVR